MEDAADPVAKAPPVLQPEKILILDQPIKLGDIAYGELKLREPTAGEMDDLAAKNGISWSIALVRGVSGLPEQVIRRLPIRVLNEAMEYLLPFTNNVRPTGQDA